MGHRRWGAGPVGAGLLAASLLLLPGASGADVVDPDEDVLAFGDAPFLGSTGDFALDPALIGLAASPTGDGYWLAAADGSVFAFGDARFAGSMAGLRLLEPVVGIAATPSGDGYWLVARDGGIFAFGDATFHGSTGGTPLNQPIVGMAPTPSGNGYWLVARDGGIFAFGDATFHGSAGSTPLPRAVVGITATPSGDGYWMVTGHTCVAPPVAAAIRPVAGLVQLLTDVRVSEHPCTERVTFEFRTEPQPGVPPTVDEDISYEVTYQSPPFGDTAGRVVPVAGSAFIQVRVEPGRTVDLSGPNLVITYPGPDSIVPAGTTAIREVRLVDDFEANMIWAIGLDRVRPFTVTELDGPDRLVIDIH